VTVQTPDNEKLPPLGITMGCPVGIEPEIILRFLTQAGTQLVRWPVVIGDAGVLRRCAATLGVTLRVVDWQPGAPCQPQALNVLSLSDLGDTLVWGKPTGETGRAMGGYIEEAARLVRQGQLAGLVTCPISKAALKAGGYRFPGHTEMLAELCQAKDFAMMMAGARLRVTLVSIHQPLAEVPAAITLESVLRMITITGRALRDDFGVLHFFFQFQNATFHKCLFIFSFFVLGIFGKISVTDGFLQTSGHLFTAYISQFIQFILNLFQTILGHKRGLVVIGLKRWGQWNRRARSFCNNFRINCRFFCGSH